MALSALDDKAKRPDDKDLAEVLGRSKARWDELITHVAAEYEPVTEDWAHSGAKYGWCLRLKRKKRTLLYLIPCQRHFLCAFVFGGKATEVARKSALPADVMTTINEARVYAEGRGFRLEVRTKANVATMMKLAAIKMAN
ncbi:MAG: DUF3788 domain-containing protein, partial [Planctomycetota bacterium]|jgi:hypothetical protein